MNRIFAALFLFGLAGCGPAPYENYCSGLGIHQGDSEYANCTQYYFHQQDAFLAERGICEREADATYPQSLYSRPSFYPVRYYGPHGGFPHTEMVSVGADYQQNAQLDALRMRIVAPCMQARGWNSPDSWQAGRHAVNMRPLNEPKPKKVPPLPWQ